MRIAQYLAILLTASACSTTVTVYEDEELQQGLRQVTFKNKLIKSAERVVVKRLPEYETEDHSSSCTYSGLCYGCRYGTDIHGEYKRKCGYGFHNDCDGHRYRKYLNSPYIYRKVYTLKDERVYKSVEMKELEREVLVSGPCR